MATDTQSDWRFLRRLSPAFLEKYNKVGPRYTSYPTAPEWSEAVTEGHFCKTVRTDAEKSTLPLSMYVHIPFCEHRCAFCACNVVITRKQDVIERYLDDLICETDILAGLMNEKPDLRRPLIQVHFGGGTPTYLSPQQIQRFFEHIRRCFPIAPDAEISMEADPCVTTEAHLETLRELGFNRISFGVQDFHEPTQQAIQRIQSVEQTQRLVEFARKIGFVSANLDLVCGLPFQTEASFEQTLETITTIRPERIALYNFAYLPTRASNQRSIDSAVMPQGVEKFGILSLAYERLPEAGYRPIGMDHFALSDDDLSLALDQGTLRRNFMGYTTCAGADLYSVGVSSISMADRLYVQSTKNLKKYHQAIQDGRLPIEKGIVLNDDDCIRRAVIEGLMCMGVVKKQQISETYGIDFDAYFDSEMKQLVPLIQDGLVLVENGKIELTRLGLIFARNTAMVFDVYLKRPEGQHAFSRTL